MEYLKVITATIKAIINLLGFKPSLFERIKRFIYLEERGYLDKHGKKHLNSLVQSFAFDDETGYKFRATPMEIEMYRCFYEKVKKDESWYFVYSVREFISGTVNDADLFITEEQNRKYFNIRCMVFLLIAVMLALLALSFAIPKGGDFAYILSLISGIPFFYLCVKHSRYSFAIHYLKRSNRQSHPKSLAK
ncbi:hypothetical protein [Pleionea sp. CnH1-48]|uniref:hypothetical protein n=1 Tax=Pleionea sp. CnH1-48 TaxID=2954494 RepID=UPI00209723D0|nr:hypothetical protein [Pleionea sp. CnH1-48]MCO7227614.1 hypothetical protein [Pleionea sp. CnH1-48]